MHLLKKSYHSKPFGGNFRIDWSNPVTKNLKIAIPLGEAGSRCIEYVERIYSEVIAGTDCPVVKNGKRYWANNSLSINTNIIKFLPKSGHLSIGTGPYTVLARIWNEEFGSYISSIISQNYYDPNWCIGVGGSGGELGCLTMYDNGGYPSTSEGLTVVKKWNTIGWIRSSSELGGYYYINGDHAGVLTHNLSINSAATIQIGKNEPYNNKFSHYGYIDYVYIWQRALSIEEVRGFHENPNQIFEEERKYFEVSHANFGNVITANISSKKAIFDGSLKNLVEITANIISKKASISAEIISGVNTVRANIKSKKAKCLHYRLLCIGQSNMAGWDSSTPKNETSEPHSIMWKGATNHWEKIICPDATSGNPGTGSSMMPTLLDKLYKLTGESIGSLNAAYGGIGVVEGNSGQDGWSDIESTPWKQMIVNSQSCCSNKFDFIIHWGGESDAGQSISKTAFKAGFKTMLANLRQLIGNANGYIFTVKQNFLGGSTNNEIRDAFDELEKEDPRLIVFDDAANYETFDSYVHISKENMVIVGEKAAQAVYDWAIATTKNRLITSVKSKKATISGSARVALFTSISIIPARTRVAFGKQRQFNAIARDQEGLPLLIQPEFTWSVNAGAIATINRQGLLTADEVEEKVTVTATVGEISGTAVVTILEKIGSSINKTAACAACAVSPFI